MIGSGPTYVIRKRISLVASLRDIEAGAVVAILGYAPKCRGERMEGEQM